MKRIYLLLAVVLLTACQASAERVVNKESNVGISGERLERIAPVMDGYIEQKKLSGMVTLVAKDGEIVHWQAHGMQDRERGIPMQKDTLFRIYSMTKPVTAVAALTLWEQGKFHMFDPIHWYLPELKDMKVYESGEGEDMVLVDAQSPIRVIDLFMHTSGFSYGFTQSPLDKVYQEKLSTRPPAELKGNMLETIASLPLHHQPGTAWHYGISTDVLGLLVERLTDKPLGEYMQEVIFDPLKMVDTGFFVPAEKHSRLAQIYTVNQQGETIVMEDEPLGDYLTNPPVHNAGGGLVSSMSDYYRFAQMLLNGGELDGQRILGRKTVEYMRTNHLPENLVPFADNSPGEGFGLAVSVTVDPSQVGYLSSEGDFGWGGLATTYARIDPKENMVVISMTQLIPYGFHRYQDDFRNLVYQSLVD